MPGYFSSTLQQFQHVAPSKPKHSPHPWQRPNYGAKLQFASAPDTTTTLDASNKLRILEVLGTLLFYARAIDITLLTAIGELATDQLTGTAATMANCLSCSIVMPQIPTPPFASLPVARSSRSKATPPFCPSSKSALSPPDTSTSPLRPPSPMTPSNPMAPPTSCVISCARSYRVPPKLN